MKIADIGALAKVHYTTRMKKNGQVVGSSKGSKPLTFRIGKGKVIRGLEKGVIGMQVGQTRTIELTAAEAYGLRNDELVITIARSELPEHMKVAPGRTVQYVSKEGQAVNLVVLDADDNNVTLDGNHPLAGEDLSFEVVLVDLT